MNIEVISVNYNTPDLIERLVLSVRLNEGNLPIRIIDGSNQSESEKLSEVLLPFENVTVEKQGWNIHHGRGMDLALSTSKYDYCLIMDSDNYLKRPIVKYMMDNIGNHKMFGWYCFVNEQGISSYRKETKEHYIKYFHPSFLLISTEFYRNSESKMIHHGAPCIEFMKSHNSEMNEIAVDLCESLLIEFSEINDIVSLNGRGTVSRFGYNLK